MSTNLQSVLADREYKNWLRAGLSLKYARQGILKLVINEIDKFHEDVLKLLQGSCCNSCQIIQTRGVFSIRCPNSVCDKIFTAISNEHRFKPAWKNTDCQMWCSDSWQLAKCFMPVGYTSKISAEDTDLPGLLDVIINNRRFDNIVVDKMGNRSNIFCQARDVINAVMHTEDYRVTDTDLAEYFQTLQIMLYSPKCFNDPDGLNAKIGLKDIQNGSLFVTTNDEAKIRAEVFRAIEETKPRALLAIDKFKEEADIAIKQTADDAFLASQKEGVLLTFAAKKKLFDQHLPELVRQVNAVELLPYLPCLSMSSKEEVERCQNNYGKSIAMQKLHENIVRRPEGLDQLVIGLRKLDFGHLADLIDPDQQIPDKQERTEQETNTSVGSVEHLDPNIIHAYLNALREGRERSNVTRVMIVGYGRVGKTSFIRNLLGLPHENIEQTDGIDVHTHYCSKLGDWNEKEIEGANMRNIKRLAKSMPEEITNKGERSSLKRKLMPEEIIEKPIPKKTRQPVEADVSAIPGEQIQHAAFDHSNVIPRRQEDGNKDQFHITSRGKEDIIKISKAVEKMEHRKIIKIWDFGGQFVYYATHQLFHSRQAVYVLVLDASTALDQLIKDDEFPDGSNGKTVKSYCKFWMQSIHSYVGTIDGEPPVILVATKIDQTTLWDKQTEENFFEEIRNIFDETQLCQHVQSKTFSINNKDTENSDLFKEIRLSIEEVAEQQKNWINETPTRWIPLENAIFEKRKESIISMAEFIAIDSENDVPIFENTELKAFLSYHSTMGNLVYFDEEDLSDKIVLDSQWIVNAFRCIITSRMFCKTDGKMRPEWKSLVVEATLTDTLIDWVWSNDHDNKFIEHKTTLLLFLCKLGIISRICEVDIDTKKVNHSDSFIVPSLLRSQVLEEDMNTLLLQSTGTATCLVFEFGNATVPVTLYQRITAAAVGKWKVLVRDGRRLLFENLGVYELDQAHSGIIEFRDTTIEIRVVNLCKDQVSKTQTDKLRRLVKFVITKESTRYRSTNEEPYKLSIRCNYANSPGKEITDVKHMVDCKYESIPCPDRIYDHVVERKTLLHEWQLGRLTNDVDPDETVEPVGKDLGTKVTERQISKIASSIGLNWQCLGLDLNLTQAQLDHVTEDNPHSTKLKIYHMLKLWLDTQSEKATLSVLLKSIRETERRQGLTVDWDGIKNMMEDM